MGQLSDNGDWWWNGREWTPSHLSPDRLWNWDGHAWQSVDHTAPAAATAVSSQPVATLTHDAVVGEPRPEPDELDDPHFGEGELPSHVASLPTKPSVQLSFVAIGWGWVARRVVRWHLSRFAELQSVAVVPPKGWDEEKDDPTRPGPLPDLAMRDFFGRCMRIEVGQMTQGARKELLAQLPMSAHVTPAAELFLEEGRLPGKWGQRLAATGPR
jgi:hypothetical protein